MKIFVLASRIPFPLEKGDKLRIYHQVKELSKNHEIFLCCLYDSKIPAEAKSELEKICKHVAFVELYKWKIAINLFLTLFTNKPFQVSYFYQKKAQRKIDKMIREFAPDHIYSQLIRTSEYVKLKHHIPKTLDYMDSFSKGMDRRAEKASFFLKPLLESEAKRLLRYENLIFDYFDNHSIISEQDRDEIWHEDREKIKIIPNGLDSSYFYPKEINKKYDLLFSGNMSYIPNVDAALFLAKEIFPIVQEKIPTISLLIAGANPHSKIEMLKSDSIKVSGWMDDIREAYWSASVFVAPLRLGSGLQNKLLEAMATKTPSVTSSLANNALGAMNNHEILIANDPQEFAEQIVELLNNKILYNELKENAYQFVCSNFNWQTSTQILESVILASSDG